MKNREDLSAKEHMKEYGFTEEELLEELHKISKHHIERCPDKHNHYKFGMGCIIENKNGDQFIAYFSIDSIQICKFDEIVNSSLILLYDMEHIERRRAILNKDLNDLQEENKIH